MPRVAPLRRDRRLGAKGLEGSKRVAHGVADVNPAVPQVWFWLLGRLARDNVV
jgi:hypothetical protein